MPQNKFKVGDRIKVVQSGYGTSPNDIGKEAIVETIGRDYMGSSIDPGITIKRIGRWTCTQDIVGELGFEVVEASLDEEVLLLL